MQLNLKPREDVERALKEHAAKGRRPEPPPINVRVVTDIGADSLLEFPAGRYMLVPPTPFDIGGQLYDLRIRIAEFARIEEPSREQVAELRGLIGEAVRLMGAQVRPLRYRNRGVVGMLSRFAWRFRRNPFRDATVAEVGWLLGFFSTRQTRPRVRLAETAGASPSH